LIMQPHLIVALLWIVLLTGCTDATKPSTSTPGVRLHPVVVREPIHRHPDMREGEDLSRLAFRIETDWTTGPIELRFPEVLNSSMGYHFLDNYAADLTPIHEWDVFPEWKTNASRDALSYDFLTPEGLRITAAATAVNDEVHLELTVANETEESISNIQANCCLTFHDCPELDAQWTPSALFAVLDGEFQSLANVTPTPEQMGREPWFLILREEAAQTTGLPAVSPTWWRIDQHHTENLMAAVSRDRAHLVGYTWSVEPIGLMSNGGNPCLHTGTGPSPELARGESYTWHGKIYLLPNNPAELMTRYQRDQLVWQQSDREARERLTSSK
jgi:hypothetical protein